MVLADDNTAEAVLAAINLCKDSEFLSFTYV